MKLSKEERSWILYDCGNSAYSMAVTTALLPIIFGMFDNVGSSMDLGYFNSIASILVAVLSPILGTIADYKDRKKRFLFFRCAWYPCNRLPGLRVPGQRSMAVAHRLLHSVSGRLRRV